MSSVYGLWKHVYATASLSFVSVSVPSLSQVMFMDCFPHSLPDLNPNVIFHLILWNHLFFLLYCFSVWPSDGSDLWPPSFVCFNYLWSRRRNWKKKTVLFTQKLTYYASWMPFLYMFWSRVILTQTWLGLTVEKMATTARLCYCWPA